MTTDERKRVILEMLRAAHNLTMDLFLAGEGEWRQSTGQCFHELEELFAESQGQTREEFRIGEGQSSEN